MEVGIPIAPELDNIEECLKDRLILIVAARSSQRHHRLSVFEDDAGCQRVTRSRARPQLRGARRIEPELLASHAHADAGITKNDGAADPAAAGRTVEYIAGAVNDRD